MFLVVGPADTARELQVIENIIIGLAEPGVGIEDIGIAAEKIIVARVVNVCQLEDGSIA